MHIYCSIKSENYHSFSTMEKKRNRSMGLYFVLRRVYFFCRQRGKVSGKILGLLLVRAVRPAMEDFVSSIQIL